MLSISPQMEKLSFGALTSDTSIAKCQQSYGSVTEQDMRLLISICCCIFLHCTAQASVVRTTPLIQAVQGGHMPLIGQLIRGGTEVNAIDVLGRTATHYAVSRDNQEALKLLLDNGADANLADNDGNTPLDMWHEHKNEKMLALLHAAGAKPSFTEAEEQQSVISPATNTEPLPEDTTKNSIQDLWQAAANNDRLSAERLLTAGADAKAENDAGKVPFDIAVEAEHYALAAILLKAAVGINGRDRKSWSPLNWAIFGDAWDLVRELIREGADINVGRSQNAFDVATLMESEAKLIEVFIAEKGVDAIVRDGWTTLIYASRYGYTQVVKFLIDNGADLNIKGKYGWTALMYAAREGHTEVIKLLIDNGADLNHKNNGGVTALIYAAREGHTEVVKFLVDNGADMNIKTKYGDTALALATQYGNIEIVELLVKHKLI